MVDKVQRHFPRSVRTPQNEIERKRYFDNKLIVTEARNVLKLPYGLANKKLFYSKELPRVECNYLFPYYFQKRLHYKRYTMILCGSMYTRVLSHFFL